MGNKVLVANLNISAVTKSEFLQQVKSLLASNEQTFITTPNSEFLFAALRSGELRDLFNSSDIALADGIAILWAERYLSWPLRAQSFWGKVLEAWVHIVISGARILLTPKYLYKNIPQKITGADVFFDLVKLAAENNKSIFLVNDQLNSAQLTADLLRQQYPNLKVAVSQKHKDDLTLLEDIMQAAPDMLFIAYGQPRQEKWIKQHLPSLPVKIAMGVGGTFDYAAGVKRTPPSWIRNMGLEWLFRLVTQPRRWRRIIDATVGLVVSLVRFKVFSTFPYRGNVSCVVINNDNKIFLFCSDPNRIIKNGQFGLKGKKFWLFPQGGIKSHEDLVQSAKRELIEEANLAPVEYIGTAKYINKYEWTNGYRSLFLTRRLYRGQEQHTAFFRFTGDDSAIKLEDGMFSEWKWLNKEEVLATISPERRPAAEIVLDELSQLIGVKL